MLKKSALIKAFFGLLLACPLPSRLWASFLTASPPPRAAALGGNTVAAPDGSGRLVDNPAGLAVAEHFLATARYQRLFEGVGGDDLATGGLAAVLPFNGPGGFGASWDHLGADHLQQDRFRMAWGRKIPVPSSLGVMSFGLSLSYLKQRFILSVPLSAVTPTRVSSGAFSFGSAFLWSPLPDLTLGVSGEDLTRPNLGVIGVDRFDPTLKWGLSYRAKLKSAGTLRALVAQNHQGEDWDTQGGLEWTPAPRWGFCFRGGADKRQGAVGFGFARNAVSLDYAHVFSAGQAASLQGTGLPASHLLEVGYQWGRVSIAEDSQSYAALLKKAASEEKAQSWSNAVWTYRRALEKKPGDAAATEGYRRSLEAYNRARAAQFYRWGAEAESRGFLLEAQRQYEWAAQLDPTQPALRAARDRLRTLTPSVAPSGALADPRVVDWLRQSAALAAQNRREEAGQVFQKAKNLYPNDPALANFEKALTTQPAPVAPATQGSDPLVERLLAESEIYLRKGRSDLARETWKRVIQVDPENTEVKAKLEAEETGASRVKTASPDDQARAQDLYERGLKAYLSGDTRKAVNFWEEALNADPQHVNALNNLVRAKLELSSFRSNPSAPEGTAP